MWAALIPFHTELSSVLRGFYMFHVMDDHILLSLHMQQFFRVYIFLVPLLSTSSPSPPRFERMPISALILGINSRGLFMKPALQPHVGCSCERRGLSVCLTLKSNQSREEWIQASDKETEENRPVVKALLHQQKTQLMKRKKQKSAFKAFYSILSAVIQQSWEQNESRIMYRKWWIYE